MRHLIITGCLLSLLACNTSDLVGDPSGVPSPHPSVTYLPTPTGTPVDPFVTDHDCGNADFQAFEGYDSDDYPAPPDNYLCYWSCVTSSYWWYPPTVPPPYELIVEFDLDVPFPAYQESAAYYLPCYSAHP
jgi:hypothetical protein